MNRVVLTAHGSGSLTERANDKILFISRSRKKAILCIYNTVAQLHSSLTGYNYLFSFIPKGIELQRHGGHACVHNGLLH
jgi:hypothetical protein